MKFDPRKHHRCSIRLVGYDYSQTGAYFVTLVSFQRECIFGEMIGESVHLSAIGRLVEQEWIDIVKHFNWINLDEIVVMPNHILAIIWIEKRRGEASVTGHQEAGQRKISRRVNPQPTQETDASPQPAHGTQQGSLGAIIQNFKSISTRKINIEKGEPGNRIWQRNYFEHIIRDEPELLRIRQYIIDNPLKWQLDQENQIISNR